MSSQEEKNNDTVSTSYSILLEKENILERNSLLIKMNNKRKNKNKRLFKVKIGNKNIKLSKLISPKNNSFNKLKYFDFEIPNFLQDKIEMKKKEKMEVEIINYENIIKNYSNEEKELFLTPKESFINSVIDKYKIPLFITYKNQVV